MPALQTTLAASGNGDLDALTLVLVVVFIASMVGLTALSMRRSRPDEPEGISPTPAAPSEPIDMPVAERLPSVQPRAASMDPSPVWLAGVSLPNAAPGVSQASSVIEELLAARRDRDLMRGLALYSASFRGELLARYGVDEAGLREIMRAASFQGEPPGLRSVEIVDGGATQTTARAGYTDGTWETYRFVRSDDGWLIDGIERPAVFR